MTTSMSFNLLRLVTVRPLLIVLFAFAADINPPRLNAAAQSPQQNQTVRQGLPLDTMLKNLCLRYQVDFGQYPKLFSQLTLNCLDLV